MATPSARLLPQGPGRIPRLSRKRLHLLCVLIGVGVVWLIGHARRVPLTRQVAQVSDAAAHLTSPGWLTGLPTESRPPEPPCDPPVIETAFNSDVAGPVVARVRERIDDSVTGTHVLISQGTLLMGRYNPQVIYGQEGIEIKFDRP